MGWLCGYVKNAAVNMRLQSIPVPKDIPQSGTDELVGSSIFFLIFVGTTTLFSTVGVPIYIPNNSVQDFPFIHILVNTYLFFFDADKAQI